MIDIKLLRENPDFVREQIARKKFKVDVDAILALDGERRGVIGQFEVARARQNAANSEMARLPKGSDEFKAKVAEMKLLSAEVKSLEAKVKEYDERWRELFLTLPNIPHPSVPNGRNETDNVVVRTVGETEGAFPHAKPHYDIAWFPRLVDLERGAKVTGAGFPFLVGDMARLMRALINFCLEEASRNGYTEFMSPLLVNAASATATGQLPDKEGQMYHMPVDDFYLIPTSEVPVTNYFRDEVFKEEELPVKRTCYTPCFRREAGSYGKDVRGLNRLHQFDKVEIVKWTHPETSFDELESLRDNSEGVLRKLGLPYRVLLICSGDIGFPHSKQYDLEVWAAGQKRWLEVSSCSCFTDFQARRANIRFRDKDGKLHFVHTLNGSALGLARTFAAILENGLQPDGTVKVPDVLVPMVGKQYVGIPG